MHLDVLISQSHCFKRRSVEGLKIYILKQVSDRSRNVVLLSDFLSIFRAAYKDLGDQFEVYIFAPLYIILFTSPQTSSPPNPQSSVRAASHPRGNTNQAEKYNNAELTRSDSRRLTQ